MSWTNNDSSQVLTTSFSPSKLNADNVEATKTVMYRGETIWTPNLENTAMLVSPIKYRGAEVPYFRYRGVNMLHKINMMYGSSCGNWLPTETGTRSVVEKLYPGIYYTDGSTMVGWNDYCSSCCQQSTNYWTMEIRCRQQAYASNRNIMLCLYKCTVSVYLNGDGEFIYYAKDSNGNGISGTEISNNDITSWLSSCKDFDAADNDNFYYMVVNARADLNTTYHGIPYQENYYGSYRTAFGMFLDTWGGNSGNASTFANELLTWMVNNRSSNNNCIDGDLLKRAINGVGAHYNYPSFKDMCYNVNVQGTFRKYLNLSYRKTNASYRHPMNTDPTIWTNELQENTYGSGYSAYAKDEGTQTGYRGTWPSRGGSFQSFFNWCYTPGHEDCYIKGVSSCDVSQSKYMYGGYYLHELDGGFIDDNPAWYPNNSKLCSFNWSTACYYTENFSVEWRCPIRINYEPRWHVKNYGYYSQSY